MMNLEKIAIVICLLIAQGYAFSPVASSRSTHDALKKTSLPSKPAPYDDLTTHPVLSFSPPMTKSSAFFSSKLFSTATGLITGLSGFVAAGMAEDLEYAELPPPYVPALFGVVLVAGVGVLTASLGDVMTEEANLGLQSGARAKKEIERSRSSYFKRK